MTLFLFHYLIFFSVSLSLPLSLKEEVCHVYDEMLAVYSLAGPATVVNSSETYSVIQYIRPTAEDSSLYSLIAPH